MTRPLQALAIAAMVPIVATARLQPVFRSGVDAVRIDVSVMNGVTPVPGLTIDNFEVTDNGVRQTLESISLDTVPLSLMLVFDNSASLTGEPLKNLIEAGNGLVRALGPDDTAALMTFSEPIRLAVPLTKQRDRLLAELNALKATGATSLNDAVFLALQLRPADAAESRPAVLVFSDGRDTSSWLSGAQVLEATRRSGMLVHVVELVPTLRNSSPFTLDLAEAGGGRRWSATSSGDLRELFGKVLNELRSRYLLTYYPKGVTREGWHNVKVSLKRARGDVTARPGYYVPPQIGDRGSGIGDRGSGIGVKGSKL